MHQREDFPLLQDTRITRSIFPTPPDAETVEAFKRHVRETGQPETFESISTSRPPADGDLQVLTEGVNIDINKRPDRDFAPCPLCSPDRPKFRHDGLLIWCEASSAIYCIGPQCGDTEMKSGRLSAAINVFRRSEKSRADARALAQLVRAAPALRSWIKSSTSSVEVVDRAHLALAKGCPKLRAALARALRPDGNAIVADRFASQTFGRIAGLTFLSGGWNNAKDLAEADAVLVRLEGLARNDPDGWSEGLADAPRAEHLRAATQALAKLKAVAVRATAASMFLASSNLDLLARWGAQAGAPVNFQVLSTATKIDVRHGAERAELPVGIVSLGDLPDSISQAAHS